MLKSVHHHKTYFLDGLAEIFTENMQLIIKIVKYTHAHINSSEKTTFYRLFSTLLKISWWYASCKNQLVLHPHIKTLYKYS